MISQAVLSPAVTDVSAPLLPFTVRLLNYHMTVPVIKSDSWFPFNQMCVGYSKYKKRQIAPRPN